jgi:Bacterial dnaA protein helix-turn-helix
MLDRQEVRIWPVTLPQIETTVSAYLGPGRVLGNKQGECFSRQISMYLAKHVGGWSTPQIGRFYNGRHHTTVLYAIEKIERLRNQDPSVDALLEVILGDLRQSASEGPAAGPLAWSREFIEALADRVLHRLMSGKRLPLGVDDLLENFSSNRGSGHPSPDAAAYRRKWLCCHMSLLLIK